MEFTLSFGGADAPAAAPAPPPAARLVRPPDGMSRDRGSEEDAGAGGLVRVRDAAVAARLAGGPLSAVVGRTDVEPSVYEGGCKVWECSLDLARLVAAAGSARGLRVAEVGCGHGLPGVVALAGGAASVAFQDLNDEVLRHATAPNVLANAGADGLARSVFVAGDWASDGLARLMGGAGAADLVLTAETCYSVASIPPLLAVLDRLLAPGGEVLVAAKRFYFGVGGGSRELAERVRDDPAARFCAETVRVFDDGASNVREIVRLRRRPRTK